MKEYLNENTLFATIAMYLSESSTLVLVVEGEDDHLALKTHSSPDLRLMPGTGGRPQVLKTATLAQRWSLHRARFLVDSDYDAFSGESTDSWENVFFSETHDLFVDIAMSDPKLLPRLIDVHTASARRRPDEGSRIPEPEEIRQQGFALASQVAAVRIADTRMGLGMNFKKLPIGELDSKEFDSRSIAEKLVKRSPHLEARSSDILDEVERATEEIRLLPHPPIGDHDLFAALARVLKQSEISVSSCELHRGFIYGLPCGAISGTRWFEKTRQWCLDFGRTGFTCGSGVSNAA